MAKKLEELLKSRPITDPYLRTFLNLMVTGVWLQKLMNDILKPFGVTEPQFNVLRILRGQHGEAMNLYEIGDRMVYPTSNVSRIVDKLLEKGYVQRKESKSNRRRVDISITKTGLDILESLEPVFDKTMSDFGAKLGPDAATQLSDALESLREN